MLHKFTDLLLNQCSDWLHLNWASLTYRIYVDLQENHVLISIDLVVQHRSQITDHRLISQISSITDFA